MFRNSYQRGMLTVFFSCGSKPLALWDTFTGSGYIARFLDPDIKSTVFEIGGSNVSTTYMTCPKGNMVLGITMPFLVMIVKNLKKYFSFEVTALDETGTRRRFRVSNFQSSTQIAPLCTVMPIGLAEGWNQIQFNLAEFMRRAYKKQFVEVQKLKINANIRIRRIYFAERLLPEDQLPPEYKLYFPLSTKGKKIKGGAKENVEPKTSEQIKESIEEKKSSKVTLKSASGTASSRNIAPKQSKISQSKLVQTAEILPEQPEVVVLGEPVAETSGGPMPDAVVSEVAEKLPAEDVTEPQGEGATEPQGEGATEPQGEGATEPQGEGATEPQGEGATEPQGEGATEPQGEGATEPQGEGATEPQGEGATEPQGEGDTEPQGEAATESHGEAATESHGENASESRAEDANETQDKNASETQDKDAVEVTPDVIQA